MRVPTPARPLEVLQSRFGECLFELVGALDGVLDGRWDALNVAIALSSEPRRTAFICPMRLRAERRRAIDRH